MKGGRRVRVRGMSCEKDSTAIAGFEDGGKGPAAKEGGLPPESGKGNKQTVPAPELPQKNPALQTQ